MKFERHANHRKKRIGKAWRKPKGLHNKQRDQKLGSTPMVKDGYRTPKDSRGKRKGLEVVQVYNLSDIQALDPKQHGVVIGAVGRKKKIELLEAVQKAKLTLLTGDPAEQRKALEQEFAEQKKTSEQRAKEREEKQKALEKITEKEEKTQEKPEEKADESEEDPEEKSKEEREKDKVLTKAR